MSDFKGVLFYDGDCRFCTRLAARVRGISWRHHFRLLPLQTPGWQGKLGRTDLERQQEMWLLLPDGRSVGGADALLELSRHFWWTWPLRKVATLPPVLGGLRAAYYWIARHRSRRNGACDLVKFDLAATAGG